MTGAVEVRGCRLAFDVEGSGPPIAFIQGVGVHGRGWMPQVLDIVMPPGAVSASNREPVAADLAELFGHDLADQPPIAMAQLGALRRYDATPRLRELAGIATLVLSAAHDPIAPPRFGRSLAAGIPGARFVEFLDASHGLPIQHADQVTRLLREHVERVESGRA